MKTDDVMSIALVRQIIRLDEETGRLYWLPRPESLFPGTGSGGRAGEAARWNAWRAGREAVTARNLGYGRTKIMGRNYYAHHIVWALYTGAWPALEVDHINRDRSDNRPVNLREVTREANQKNAGRSPPASSGVKGVSWNPRMRRWTARASANGKRIFLGCYESVDEAIAARRGAEAAYGYHDGGALAPS